jgi:hypothetical protein
MNKLALIPCCLWPNSYGQVVPNRWRRRRPSMAVLVLRLRGTPCKLCTTEVTGLPAYDPII